MTRQSRERLDRSDEYESLKTLAEEYIDVQLAATKATGIDERKRERLVVGAIGIISTQHAGRAEREYALRRRE